VLPLAAAARLDLAAQARAGARLPAAFAAGIALKSLDDLVKLCDPVWIGCWRSRQALKCAAAAVRLMGRNEEEAGLRDAVLLDRRQGTIRGRPARCFWPSRGCLATRKPAFSSKAMAELADLLGLAWDDRLNAATVDHVDDRAAVRRVPAPFAAADSGLGRCMRCGRMPNRLPGCWPMP
jgi:hypothetical protein